MRFLRVLSSLCHSVCNSEQAKCGFSQRMLDHVLPLTASCRLQQRALGAYGPGGPVVFASVSRASSVVGTYMRIQYTYVYVHVHMCVYIHISLYIYLHANMLI